MSDHPHPHHSKRQNRKKKRKLAKKQNQSRMCMTMSSWAENFTKAATWQLEHKVAYWKSRAKALEYENKMLYDIIRQNNSSSNCEVGEGSECEDDESGNGVENEDLEVSEEYVSFLIENAKYKEDARLERERLKAAHSDSNDTNEMEAGPSGKDKQEELKELYGQNWEKIMALESSLESEFLDKCDKEKPVYWPNIPLNFDIK